MDGFGEAFPAELRGDKFTGQVPAILPARGIAAGCAQRPFADSDDSLGFFRRRYEFRR